MHTVEIVVDLGQGEHLSLTLTMSDDGIERHETMVLSAEDVPVLLAAIQNLQKAVRARRAS